MSKLLFIGGPVDGQRIEVDERDRWEICVMPGLGERMGEGMGSREEKITHTSVQYLRQRTHGGHIMVASQLTEGEVMAKLIAGYHPGPSSSGAWGRGNEGITVKLGYDEVMEQMRRGAGFNKVTVVFTPISKD